MLSKIISAPFIFAALIFLYLSWEVSDRYAMYLAPTVISLAVIYILSPQINWWWYLRYPPKLDMKIQQLFEKVLPFYKNLNAVGKERFRDKVALFIEANDFKAKGIDSVPDDIKAVIAANAVKMTFGRTDYLFPKFETIVIYPSPFPSPQYHGWHSSEIFEEDGVILFSAEHVMKSFLQPSGFFNTALYEYARVFMLTYPDETYPVLKEDIWEKIAQISGFNKKYLTAFIGLDEKHIDVQAISMACYFVFPERFQLVLPEVAEAYQKIFFPTA